MFGWSNANCWKENGAENTAFITIFRSNSKETKFQASNIFLFLTTFPLKQRKYTTGEVKPEIISKFLPAKVISSGTALLRNSQYKTISTGMRTTLSSVSIRISVSLTNCFPFLVVKTKTITTSGGIIARKKCGGVVLVFL